MSHVLRAKAGVVEAEQGGDGLGRRRGKPNWPLYFAIMISTGFPDMSRGIKK